MSALPVALRPVSRHALALATLAAIALAVPELASAHRLNIDADPNRPLLDYIWLGFLHMATGWDHLLFIAGVVLLAGNLGRAAKLVSVFVAGHSLTLLIATLAGWKLNATAVDVVIALSVVFVGVQGLRGRPRNWRLFGGIIFAFGLVHGLGLSTRLQDLGLPEDGLVPRVLLFNVGVELGQLSVLTVLVGVAALVVRTVRRLPPARPAAYGGLILAGLAAAALISFTAMREESVAAPVPATCSQAEETPEVVTGVGGHPEKSFYEPGERTPSFDFGHVLYDGYVVVTYRPTLPVAERAQLRAWVEEGEMAVVAGSSREQKELIRAVTLRERLSCSEFDLEALALFRDRWFEEIGR